MLSIDVVVIFKNECYSSNGAGTYGGTYALLMGTISGNVID